MDGQLELLLPLQWTDYAKFVEDSTDPRATDEFRIIYPLSGLATEGGECGAFVEKFLRRGGDYQYVIDNTSKMIDEVGDIMFYVTKFCNDTGVTLERLMKYNMEKLIDRQKNGKK